MSKKVVYNHKPDPVTKINQYEWIDNKMVLTKEIYKSDHKKNVEIIKKQVLPKIVKDTFDEIDHLEKKMLLNEQMEDN